MASVREAEEENFLKAVVAISLSGLEALEMVDVPRPNPGPGEIRVRMRYAGINPADWKTAAGHLSQLPTFRPKFPFVIGFEGSGHVEALGHGVEGLAVGDRVVVKADIARGQWGAYAEYLCVDALMAARLPDGISLAEAAALPIAGLTALHSLCDHGGLAPGETVFIHAGAGGVGSFALQIARAVGARAHASCSPANAGYLIERGAVATFDHADSQMVALAGLHGPFDMVLDAVGGASHDLARLLRPGGRYVTIPTLGAGDARPTAAEVEFVGARLIPGGLIRDRTRAGLEKLTALHAEGKLSLPELRVLPADGIVAALAECRTGSRRGKTVIELWH